MITNNQVEEISSLLNSISEFKDKNIVDRTEWGTINFHNYSDTFEQLWDIVEKLNNLPLQHLSSSVANESKNVLEPIKAQLENINSFSIETNNPTNQRDQLGNKLNQLVKKLHENIAVWLPYLMYQKGDISENIKKLSDATREAKQIIEDAKSDISKKKDNVDSLVNAVRKASATAGVAVFTDDFETQANDLEDDSKVWIISTIVISSILFISSLGFMLNSTFGWFIPSDDISMWYTISSKITFFIFLLTAGFWTGKVFKSYKHQSAVYKQKAIGLKTFQAFYEAAEDQQVKDAVLLETTKSIFSSINTGLVDQQNKNDESSSTQVLEIVKSVITKEEG